VISSRSFSARTRAKALPGLLRALLATPQAVLLGVLCLGLLGGLAGCGSSDNGVASKPAGEILTAARAAAQNASSVRITGTTSLSGTTLSINASLAKDHGHARLSLAGIEMEAIRTGETLYSKGNRAYNAQLESTMGIKVPAGVWLKWPVSSRSARIGAVTDIKRELHLILNASGTVTKGATVKINGQPAIELKQTATLYTQILYVATTGNPYPIQLVKHGRETGQTTFTAWNDPVSVSPPSNAIDISQLQHTKGH
jgi:hypothetical protein